MRYILEFFLFVSFCARREGGRIGVKGDQREREREGEREREQWREDEWMGGAG